MANGLASIAFAMITWLSAVLPSHATFPGINGEIVIQTKRSGQQGAAAAIYFLDPDTGNHAMPPRLEGSDVRVPWQAHNGRLRFEPDGLYYVGLLNDGDGANGPDGYALQSFFQQPVRQIVNPGNGGSSPSPMLDGRIVFDSRYFDAISAVTTETGAVEVLVPNATGFLQDTLASPVSNDVYYKSYANGFGSIWRSSGGVQEQLALVQYLGELYDITPDGRWLLYYDRKGNDGLLANSVLSVLDLENPANPPQELMPVGYFLSGQAVTFSPDGSKLALMKRAAGRLGGLDIITLDRSDPDALTVTGEVVNISQSWNDEEATAVAWRQNGFVRFDAELLPGAAMGEITFTNRSIAGDGSGDHLVPISWDFGDGSDLLESEEPQVTHTYAEPGTYNVTLTVLDKEGAPQSATQEVLVPTIVVNNNGDDPDADPDDGVIDTDLDADGFQVTLRAAITEANRRVGRDFIVFDIPDGGIPVIAPQTSLPSITEDLEIDGSTQPGTGLICLSGASAPGDGLHITNGAVGLKGFEALQFPGAAFRFSGGADHFVERCFIGVNSAGNPFGNGTGIAMNAVSRARFGNLSGTLKNIISANGNGVDLTNCVDILMHQNFVGTAPDGSTPMPNTGVGLLGDGVQNLEVCSSTAVPVVIFGKQFCLKLSNVQGSVFENMHVGVGADGQTTAPDVQEGAFFDLCENMRVIQSAFTGMTGHAIKVLGGDNIEVSDVKAGTDATGAVELACSVGLAFDGCSNLTIGSDEGTTVVGGETAIKIENVTEGQNTIKNVHAGSGIDGSGQPIRFSSTKTGILMKYCSKMTLIGKPGDAMMPENNSIINGTETAAEIEDSENITLERFSIGTDGGSGGGGGGGIGGIGLKLMRCLNLQVGKPQMAPCMIAASNGVVADFILPGQTSRFENIWLNLRADGQASISGPMQTAFRLQDSGNVQLNRINVGATLEAFRLLRANGVDLTNPFIGQAPGSSSVFDVDLGIFAKNCSQLSVGEANSPAFLTAKQGMLLEECSEVILRQLKLNMKEDGSASQGNGERGILCKLTSVIDISGLQAGAFSQAAFEATDSDTINIDDVAIGLNADATEAFPVDIGVSFKRCSKVFLGVEDFVNRICAGKAIMVDDLRATGPEGNAIRNVHVGLAANGSALGAIDTAIDVNNARDLSLDSFRVSRTNHDAFWLRLSERIRLEKSWFGVGLDPETNFQIGGDAVRVEGCSDVGLIQNQLRNALGSGLRVDNQSSKITHRKNLIFDNVIPPDIDTPAVHIDAMTSILTKMNLRFNGTLLEGTITGPPNTTVTLDIYATDPGAPFVESQYHLGSEEITFDAAGNATPGTSLEGTVPPGWQATFTLTDSALGTTDFSPAMPVTVAPDRDDDGLPDFWEERYPTILDPDDDSDAGEDPDGDGRDNTREFVEGTDPRNSDVPPQPSMTLAPDSVEIAVEVKSGRYYTLQRSPTLGFESWEDIETRYLVNGGKMTLVDPEPVPGADRMFYRILTEIPDFE